MRMDGAILMLGVALASVGCAAVTPGTCRFDDAVTISNGKVRVAVSPAVGRIVDFGTVGGPNLLWVNREENLTKSVAAAPEWSNYGGDKVWPSQQSNWLIINGRSWPPDSAHDGLPWTLVEHSPRRIVIQSPDCPNLGIRIVRSIELTDDESLSIRNRLERYEANPFPVFIWSITQVHPPECGLLDMWAKQPFPGNPITIWIKEIKAYAIAGGKAAVIEPAKGLRGKAGTFGSWIAAVYPGLLFVQAMECDRGACHPDRATMELYCCPEYSELETLSESCHLKPGESLENTVKWLLLKRPPQASLEEIANFIDKAVKPQ